MTFKNLTFYYFPVLWLPIAALLLYFSENRLGFSISGSTQYFVANFIFLGFLHVFFTAYFVLGDSSGTRWFQSLSVSRKYNMIIVLIISLGCISYFHLARADFFEQYILKLILLWTAWHAFSQSESLMNTLSMKQGVIKKVLLALKFGVIGLIFCFYFYRNLFIELKLASSIFFIFLVIIIQFSCLQSKNQQAFVFSLRFYFWALQFLFPILGVGTFAIHGMEYLYVSHLVFFNKVTLKLVLFFVFSAAVYLLFIFKESLFYRDIVAIVFYFLNVSHFVVDRFIFQYRYTHERENILSKLKFVDI